MESDNPHSERLHLIRWPVRINTVSYSLDSNYLAVCGGKGLIVFEASEDKRSFVPKFQDVDKDRVLSLQWSEADMITTLRQRSNGTVYTQEFKITSSPKSLSGKTGAEYNYCEHWKLDCKLDCCQFEKESEEVRQSNLALGADGTYYSPIGSQSLAIYEMRLGVSQHIELLEFVKSSN